MTDATVEAIRLSERYSIDAIITGLVTDLEDLRTGKISTREAQARAQLAHEIMRGINLVIRGQQILEQRAKMIGKGNANG
ncbi:MAG: hypothetical protein P4L82_12135 [Ancalomicrobiaceae bacterium]|nr:hypothetical protein [Ancalomicrobiaceae bacterium]